MKQRALAWGLLTLAAVACLIAYWPALGGPFLLDDFNAIHPLVSQFEDGRGWWQTLQEAPHHVRSRWLSNASFLATQVLSGQPMPSAFAFKATNLAIHFACAGLVFLLGCSLARRWGGKDTQVRFAGAFAASIFLLHPLLLSTVMYPVQRMAQLATLFSISAALTYMHWRERMHGASPRRTHAGGIAATLLLIGLAVLSKETGVLAPLLILTVEHTAFRWPERSSPFRSRFETGFGLVCAAPLVLGLVLLIVNWNHLMAGYEVRDFTLAERLLSQVHVLFGYVGQIVWPRVGAMGLLLDDLPTQRTLDFVTGLLVVATAILLALAIAARRKFPAFAFAVLWFAAAHALESTVLPLEMAFEHRNYLALAGPASAVGWWVARLPWRALGVAVAIASLVTMGHATWRRAQDWRSYPTWLAAESAHHPDSLRAGTELFLYLARSGRVHDAITERERLALRHSGHAQPVLLKLAFACSGPIPVTTLSVEDQTTLRNGRIGKDTFHVYLGLRDEMASGACEHPLWEDFARATLSISSNPAVTVSDRAAAAWWRLNGEAHRRLQDWPGVARALRETVRRQQDDPRDWLMLMHASLRQGDRAGYISARASLMRLTGGRLGSLAGELQALDQAASATADKPAQ